MEKKWKLLKKAYDNYPKGTKCQWVEFGSVMNCHGEYHFSNEYGVTRIHDRDGYAIFDGQDWAEIITEKPASILDGKVAVQVNNEREFKLLMEHYESKGWNASNGNSVKNIEKLNIDSGLQNDLWKYGQGFHAVNVNISSWNIISFADFAKEVGITAPVELGKSEDGVTIYENDPLQSVWIRDNKYELGMYHEHAKGNIYGTNTRKFFSNKEAAEKWIEEHNKPKQIVIDGTPRATVSLDGVILSSLTNYISSIRFM